MKCYTLVIIILLLSWNISLNSFLKKRHHRSKEGERDIIIRYKKNGETGNGYTSEWRYNYYILDVKNKMEPLKRFFRASFDRTLPQCIPEEQRLNLLKKCQDSVKSSVPISFEEFLEKFQAMMTEPSCQFEAFLFNSKEFSNGKDVLKLTKEITPVKSSKDCCDCKQLTKEIEDLRKKLRGTFNSEMENLYKKLIELENKNSELNQINGDLKYEKNHLDTENQNSEEEIKELENEIKDLKDSLNNKDKEDSKNKECCENLKKQKEENKKITDEIEGKKKQIDNLMNQYQTLEDSASKDKNNCCGKLNGFRSEIEELEKEKNENEEALKKLNEKTKSLEEELNKKKEKKFCVELEIFKEKNIHYTTEEIEQDPCTEDCCASKFLDAVINREDPLTTMRKIGKFEYKASPKSTALSYIVTNMKYIGNSLCLMRMEILAPKEGKLISKLGLKGLVPIHENSGFKSYAYCLNYKPASIENKPNGGIITFTAKNHLLGLKLEINDGPIYKYLSKKYYPNKK
ncbi:MAG: hypothetical protein MJ252_29045, partial [archaeon]|nr:hypothetical protein [archaeon]